MIRFYMAGEYGEQLGRPHFHACLFGIDFNDKYYWSKSPSGSKNYRSPTLEKIWKLGNSTLGAVTFESAAYTARYIMKKITGDKQEKHYQYVDKKTGEIKNRKPEFNNMSRKPGIANTWIEKYKNDVYPQGEVIVRGHKARAPRYYDNQFKKLDPEGYDLLQYGRHLEAITHAADNTDSRLAVRETVAKAKIGLLKRTLK